MINRHSRSCPRGGAEMENARREACRCAPSNGQTDTCRELLQKLQRVDFCLTETILYLDAYPHCRHALAHYHKLLDEQKRLYEALRSSGCAPLCATENHAESEWRWTEGPWPWDPEAN